MILKNFQFYLNNSVEIKNFIKDPTQSKENQNKVIKFISRKTKFFKKFKKFFFYLLIEKRRIFFVKKFLKVF